jgi:hypothetical protein
MSAKSKKSPPDAEQQRRIVMEAKRRREQQGHGYREQALKILPWVCAKCSRDFDGKKLHQLTVHHKDHNHNNNPADGSNWELLCIYCHDDEHSRNEVAEAYDGAASGKSQERPDFKPFAGLEGLLKGKE